MTSGKWSVVLTGLTVVVAACTSTAPAKPQARTSSRANTPTVTPGQPIATAGPSGLVAPSSAYLSLVLPTAQPAQGCAQAAKGHDVAALVAAFRAARLAGHGAEGCLTRAALRTYSDSHCVQQDLTRSPGPVVLYRCAAYRVTAIPADRIQAARVDGGYLQLDIQLSGPGRSAAAIYEHLRVGAGTPASGQTTTGLVITSVSAI